MEHLRIRLRIQNCPPCSGLNSWYLLNQGEFKDVGAFLADVKEKFCIHVDKLRCHTRGYALPSWEHIGIIRDEDEIIVEKDEDNGYLSSIASLQYGSCNVNIGSNNIFDDDGASVASVPKQNSSTKTDELLPSPVRKKSSLVEKVRKKKKRKHDLVDEGNVNKEMDKQSFINGSEEKKKKSREVIKSESTKAERKQARKKKRKDKVFKDNCSSSRFSKLDEKDPCQDKMEICVEQTKEIIQKKTHRKNKKEISIMSDELVATNNLNVINNTPAGSRNKENGRTANMNHVPSKATNDIIASGGRGLEINPNKPTIQNNNEDGKKKIREENTSERSFQILSRSIEYVGRNVSYPSVKSNYRGNHVYFDSDEDDHVSVAIIEDSVPIITGKTNTSFSPRKERCSNSSNVNIGVGHGKKSSKKEECIVGINSATNGNGGVSSGILYDQKSHLGQHSKTDTSMEKSDFQDRNYDELTPLQGAPRVGDKIAFKVLEMSLSYTPEISDYKEAIVNEVDNKGVVTALLADQSKSRKTGDGTLTRKFELESDSDNEDNDILEIHWKEFISPKLLSV